MRQLKIIKQITAKEGPSLDKYLLEVSRTKLLSSDEETVLSQRVRKGDRKALERLVRSNLRFVISVAKQYQNQGMTLSDLISEGNLGLIKAAERFDHTKGFKFISYAVWWIRQSILQALAEQARLVKLPQNKVDSIGRINRTFAQLEQEFQRDPTADEVADILGLNVLMVNQSLLCNGFHHSLDAPLFDGEDHENSQYDLIPGDAIAAPDAFFTSSSLEIEIARLLTRLDAREAEILTSCYGLNGHPALDLDDIGRRFNITRERVRQIRDASIRKLRELPFMTVLKPYLG